MTRHGNQCLETSRRRERPLGLPRGLDGVDVVVVGAGVHRVALQDRLERRHDLGRALGRRPVRLPELPGAQVHARLGVQRRRVEIVRIPLGERFHRRVVVARELRLVGGRIGGVADREGLDVGPLVGGRGGREREGLLDFDPRLLQAFFRRSGVVVVGAEREGHAPVRHRRFRIEIRRARERPDRFFVVEAEEEHHPLIEVLLRFGARRRDRVPVRPHLGKERGGLFRGSRGGAMVVLGEECRRGGERSSE